MRRAKTISNERRGNALLMTMVCVGALGTASLSLIAVSISGAREQRSTRERLHSQYVAEAALNLGVADLQAGGAGAIAQTPLDGAIYWVDAANPTPDLAELTSTAVDDRTGARMQMTLQRTIDTIWAWAAFGQDGLDLDSNARVDSYDATAGSYAMQAVNGAGADLHANTDGHVGSNGDVEMLSNSKVWGDVRYGVTAAFSTTQSPAAVTGSISPLDDPVEFPELVAPTYPNLGNLNAMGVVNLPSGNYAYDFFTLKSNSVVNVTGPANLVVTNFEMRSNSQLLIDSSAGPVKFWVLDNFVVDNATLLKANNELPADLEFNLLSDNVIDPNIKIQLDTIAFSSNAVMHGTIYAPYARLDINSDFELYGAMVAREVHLDSNARIHFDESLAETKEATSVTWQKLAWRQIPYPN